MLTECQVWAHEVREVFPALNKYIVLAGYGNAPKKVLGYMESRVIRNNGSSKLVLQKKGRKRIKKLRREYKVVLSKELKKIEDLVLRRQVVLYTIVSKLMRIEKEDWLKSSSSYNKVKKKKISSVLVEEESLERYNYLREKEKLPKIESIQEINSGINEIISNLKIK